MCLVKDSTEKTRDANEIDLAVPEVDDVTNISGIFYSKTLEPKHEDDFC